MAGMSCRQVRSRELAPDEHAAAPRATPVTDRRVRGAVRSARRAPRRPAWQGAPRRPPARTALRSVVLPELRELSRSRRVTLPCGRAAGQSCRPRCWPRAQGGLPVARRGRRGGHVGLGCGPTAGVRGPPPLPRKVPYLATWVKNGFGRKHSRAPPPALAAPVCPRDRWGLFKLRHALPSLADEEGRLLPGFRGDDRFHSLRPACSPVRWHRHGERGHTLARPCERPGEAGGQLGEGSRPSGRSRRLRRR